uniref:Uncharacterized protein n=1 Tax=Anopheles minimus TaxID=112268 RepID=A0A182VZX0_9DIPT
MEASPRSPPAKRRLRASV